MVILVKGILHDMFTNIFVWNLAYKVVNMNDVIKDSACWQLYLIACRPFELYEYYTSIIWIFDTEWTLGYMHDQIWKKNKIKRARDSVYHMKTNIQ